MPLYTGLAALTPLISEFWIGNYQPVFVEYTLFLVVGYWFNALTVPAYFINLGTGSLRLNTIAHVVIGILNATMGYSLGLSFGGWGVVLGYVFALIIGSSIYTLGFHHDRRIPFKVLFPTNCRAFSAICSLGVLIGYGTFHILDGHIVPIVNAGLTFMVCFIPVGISFWMHPLGHKVLMVVRVRK